MHTMKVIIAHENAPNWKFKIVHENTSNWKLIIVHENVHILTRAMLFKSLVVVFCWVMVIIGYYGLLLNSAKLAGDPILNFLFTFIPDLPLGWVDVVHGVHLQRAQHVLVQNFDFANVRIPVSFSPLLNFNLHFCILYMVSERWLCTWLGFELAFLLNSFRSFSSPRPDPIKIFKCK